MTNYKVKINMRTKDIINANTASMKITPNEVPVIVSGIAVVENGGTDTDGNACDVGYIATNEGVFGFISNVMLKNIPLLADYLTECLDEGVECKIIFISGKTNAGSEFYSFKVVD